MYSPNSSWRPVMNPIPVNASLPPPVTSLSATGFVARFLLIGMAIVGAIALIVTAPLTVTVPLGFVFLAGLFGTFVLSALERRRQRRRNTHRRGPGGVSGPGRANPHDLDSASPIPSGLGALAAFSISLLAIAFLVPVELGVALAAIAMTGLFILRLFAMFGEWAPRGSAWAVPRSAEPIRVAG